MTEPKAFVASCDHHYESHIRGGEPIAVRVCMFCRLPDWDDIREQVAGIRDNARTLTPNEHDRAWYAIEHVASQDDADPGTVLNAVLRALRINAPTVEDEQAASPRLRDTARTAAKTCRCPHPVDEHSVYGCADDCACEWMPQRGAARQAAGQPSLPRRDATVDPAVCPRCKGDNQDAFELCATCAAAAPSCTCIHPPEEDAGHLLHASYCTAAVEETHIVADDSDDPEHVDDCPGCETAVDHDEHCPTPETHNWGCGCPTDKWPAADARSSIAAHMGTQGNDPTLALLLNRYHEAVARQAVAEHTAAAGHPDTQQPAEAHEPARIRIINHPGVLATADTEIAALLDAYRAEVLREAAQAFTAEADELDRAAQEALDPDMARDAKHLRGFAARLRRMADEAAQ